MTDTEIQRLFELLDEAEKMMKHFSGGYSSHFRSVEEFRTALSNNTNKLKAGDNDVVSKFYIWFAPLSDWDDFMGRDGERLGAEVFTLVSELRRELGIFEIIDLITDYQQSGHDGFDVGRLYDFVIGKPAKYPIYLNREKLHHDFKDLIAQHIITNPDTEPPTTLYYFTGSLAKPKQAATSNSKKWWRFWK